jgi:hypothetical protein
MLPFFAVPLPFLLLAVVLCSRLTLIPVRQLLVSHMHALPADSYDSNSTTAQTV